MKEITLGISDSLRKRLAGGALTRLLMYHAQISPLIGQLRTARKTSGSMTLSMHRFLFCPRGKEKLSVKDSTARAGEKETYEEGQVAQPKRLERGNVADGSRVGDRARVDRPDASDVWCLGLELPSDVRRVGDEPALSIARLLYAPRGQGSAWTASVKRVVRLTHQLGLPPLALAPLADAVGLGLAGLDEELLIVFLEVPADERSVGLEGVVRRRVRHAEPVEEQLLQVWQLVRAAEAEGPDKVRSQPRCRHATQGRKAHTSSLCISDESMGGERSVDCAHRGRDKRAARTCTVSSSESSQSRSLSQTS